MVCRPSRRATATVSSELAYREHRGEGVGANDASALEDAGGGDRARQLPLRGEPAAGGVGAQHQEPAARADHRDRRKRPA